MRAARLVACAALGILAGAARASAVPLDLAGAVRLAGERSPAIAAALKNREAREKELSNAVAAFLPSLDLSADHGFEGDSPRTKDNLLASRLSLALTETLYKNGEQQTNHEKARLEAEIAGIQYVEAREQAALDVVEEYYARSRQAALLELRREVEGALRRQFTLVSEQYRGGMRTRKDFLRFRARVRRAEIDVLAAGTELDSSALRLLQRIGVRPEDPRPEFAVEPPGGADPAAMAAAAPSYDSVPEIRRIRLRREADALDVDLVRRKHWPEIFVTAGATYGNSGYLGGSSAFAETDSVQWNALLGVRFNLWDFGVRRRNVQIAELDRGAKADVLDVSELRVRNELGVLMNDIERQRREYGMSRELLEIEEQSYRLLEDDYRQGKVSYLDLVTGLADLASAKEGFYSSHFGLLVSSARHRFYEGKLYDSIVGKE